MLYKFYFLVDNKFEGTIVSGGYDREAMQSYLEEIYEASVVITDVRQI